MLIGSTPSRRLVAVDDEQLVGLRRQLVEAAQIAQHDFERDVGPHGDVLEVHQRADHVVLEGHRRAQLLALLDRQALEYVVHHLLRQVGREIGDLVGFERLGRGDELFGVHRRDERLANGVGDLEQDVAVARGPHAGPRCRAARRAAALRGCRRCRPGAAGRARPAARPRSSCTPRCSASSTGSVSPSRRPLELLADQPLDQPMLAQEARHAGEHVLHAFRRVGSGCDRGFDGFGHWLVWRRNDRGRTRLSARHRRPRSDPALRQFYAGGSREPAAEVPREPPQPACARESSRRGPRCSWNSASARTTAGWASSPQVARPVLR